MNLDLVACPNGVQTTAGNRAVYDVISNKAYFGAADLESHALMWELGGSSDGALLTASLELDPQSSWLMRCDRVDFPPGGIAYLHTHPGGGIRCILHGTLRVETQGKSHVYKPGEAWFERGVDPVYAEASATEDTSFVRVMILPAEWQGKRTIKYVNPEDEDKPKLQVATVFFDEILMPLSNNKK